MEVCTSIDSLRASQLAWVQRAAGRPVRAGFIPTMGELHEGHRRMVEQARQENECVVLSVFVSPGRFESMEAYRFHPRDLEKDQEKALEAGVDIFFAPAVDELYAASHSTRVVMDPVAGDKSDDAKRYFDGMITEIVKLCQLVRPHTLYWEYDDLRQLGVLKKVIEDLYLPVRLVGAPAGAGNSL